MRDADLEIERRHWIGQRVELEHHDRLRVGVVSEVRVARETTPEGGPVLLLDVLGNRFVAFLVPVSAVRLVDERTPSAN